VEPSGTPGGSTVPPPAGLHGPLLLSAVALYTAGFLIWFPTALSVTDEAHYVSGALALVRAASTGVLDAFTGAAMTGEAPTTYPAGTALLQAPFVGLFGWHAAALASVMAVCLVAAVLWRWLRESGRSAAPVWLWLGFPPVLGMGRLAMSDVPAAACVTLGLYAFWKGSQAGATWRPWLAAGLATGGSLVLREPLLLILGPFAAGALFRRERHAPALGLGVLAGVSLRLLTGLLMYGDPLAVNPVGFGFSAAAVARTAPVYLFALVVLVPGCLLWMPRYRGWRWPECHAAVWGTMGFFLLYNYSTAATIDLRAVLLLGRFLVPLVPLLAWCSSSTLGVWWERWTVGRSGRSWAAVPRLWIAGVIGGVLAVHPVMASWDRLQAGIGARILAATPPAATVVTVSADLEKYIHPATGRRRLLSADIATPEAMPGLMREAGAMFVVAVERSADAYEQEVAGLVRDYRGALARVCELTLLVDEEMAPGTRLRVHRVGACADRAVHAGKVSP
jgi:4-amino-4-deoxy-L-arabinose transferase-like glycosyltransferase